MTGTPRHSSEQKARCAFQLRGWSKGGGGAPACVQKRQQKKKECEEECPLITRSRETGQRMNGRDKKPTPDEKMNKIEKRAKGPDFVGTRFHAKVAEPMGSRMGRYPP